MIDLFKELRKIEPDRFQFKNNIISQYAKIEDQNKSIVLPSPFPIEAKFKTFSFISEKKEYFVYIFYPLKETAEYENGSEDDKNQNQNQIQNQTDIPNKEIHK